SFVRINPPGDPAFEFGYNTSGRPVQYGENNSPTFTKDLPLSAIPIVNIGGVNYRQFLLDINQTNSGTTDHLLSLNEVQIFQGNTANMLGATGPNANGVGQVSFGKQATLIYDLQGLARGAATSTTITMDYALNTGSGSGDIYAYIPDSLFDPTKMFVTL